MKKTPSAICFSHIGKRTNYEDNFLLAGQFVEPETQVKMPEQQIVHRLDNRHGGVRFYAVCDGMGGQNAGEIASEICVK